MKLTLVPCGNSPVMVDMGNLIVAVLGASDYASSLGKKGTAYGHHSLRLEERLGQRDVRRTHQIS